MSKQSDLGKKGEELAVEFLRKKDYVILERNYKWDKAEVDIIGLKNDKIVFVEVKTRISPYLNGPSLMVPVKKQKQIIKVADAYMKQRDDDLEAQFDIVSVVTNNEYTIIEHYDEAFVPGVSS